MASNSSSARDPQGQYDDWIEIYNYGSVAIDIGGFYLTDNPAVPTKWRIPDTNPAVTTIGAGGYLLIWADNDTTYSGLHANFKLDAGGEQIALFDSDGVTLIDEVVFVQQTTAISSGRFPDASDNLQVLDSPSPGGENFATYLGQVADTKFSHNRGFYNSPFSVTIATETKGAVIYYTLDGSEPYNTISDTRFPRAIVYNGPVSITTTTSLRAIAVKPGFKSTNIDTQTYIFLDDVIRQPVRPDGFPTNWGHTGRGDYEMDPEVVNNARYRNTIKDDLMSVPSLSLVMDVDDWFKSGGQGIYIRGERSERAVSAELILPDGRQGFQINCSVMIVGGSSVNRWKMDKLSMRLKFKSEYGSSKLRFPVFGEDVTDEFDTLVVDARMNNSWGYGGGVMLPNNSRPWISGRPSQRDVAQYTRDPFVADIQNTMGGYAPHGRHIHLYLNGLYWGMYWLHERPDEHFAAAYFGGNDEDYDVIKHRSNTVINGSGASYNQLFNIANAGLASENQYQQIQQYLDVPDLIDYMITNFYVGNTDWAHQNWYATYNNIDPNGQWRYHSWDAEHVMEGINANVTGKNDNGGPTRLHQMLIQNAEYRMLFADHVNRHFFNNGILTSDGAMALYQIRLDDVDRAVVAESARWGDNHSSTPYTRDVDWIRERDWL
ncbi:MAG: CotH kinase family protein, partial [Planctomycetota bacterium]